ncbi:hypothetical protein Dsin_022458 [Dipteronia sinensis]|uniref:Transposase MuDR plant domain-containing protein n=1 Tax=Dipteronia sinensis TaxID=43782 RepID=A0AAE0DZT5_9ROSI|nr:hypothetical protein Dsin_022458 [Dipteronia sinensis]
MTGQRGLAFDFPRDANYDQLLDKVYRVIGIDRNHYRVTLTTVAQTFRPSLPIEIIDDDDVALLLCRENFDPLVCISIVQIDDDRPELKQNFCPKSPHPSHHATQYNFQHTVDVPNPNTHLDDIRDGFIETANNVHSPHRHFGFHDTTENQNVSTRNVSEPQFDPIPYHVPNWYALANRFQTRVIKSDTTRYQVQCIVEECNWRLRAVKVANSDYFYIRRFNHEHTCSNKARFSLQRQASAWVIGEHIKEKFHDHGLYKPKEIIQDIQTEFGISYNYHNGYRAKHIALDEVQGTPVES